MKRAWLVMAIAWAGCNSNSVDGQCSQLSSCPRGAYQFCADGAGGRYVLSDGSQESCASAVDCARVAALVDAWCAGSAAAADLGVVGPVPIPQPPFVTGIAKSGAPYTGPHIDPMLDDASQCPDSDLEPNDDRLSAIAFSPMLGAASSRIVKLAICPRGGNPSTGRPDVDLFAVTVAGNGPAQVALKVNIFYDITYGDLDVGIFDGSGQQLAADGSAITNGCAAAAVLPGTVYYVAVLGANNVDVNKYEARINATSAPSTCP